MKTYIYNYLLQQLKICKQLFTNTNYCSDRVAQWLKCGFGNLRVLHSTSGRVGRFPLEFIRTQDIQEDL